MKNSLKAVREKAGMSQEKLAEVSGVARSIISAIENGRVDSLNSRTMVRIADALGVKVDDIFLF